MSGLRVYQRNALEQARYFFRLGHRSVLVQLATGLGKTRIFAEACRGHVLLDGKVLVVTPRRELVAQAARTLDEIGLFLERDVFVRSIQGLLASGPPFEDITMIVIDEARHFVADEWSKVRAMFPDALVLGFDATPERGDGRGLGAMFEKMVEGLPIAAASLRRESPTSAPRLLKSMIVTSDMIVQK